MKFVFSPDVILCGWLGSKHQLTNKLLRITIMDLFLQWYEYIHKANTETLKSRRRRDISVSAWFTPYFHIFKPACGFDRGSFQDEVSIVPKDQSRHARVSGTLPFLHKILIIHTVSAPIDFPPFFFLWQTNLVMFLSFNEILGSFVVLVEKRSVINRIQSE